MSKPPNFFPGAPRCARRSMLDLERNNAMKASLTIAIFLTGGGIALAYTPAKIAAKSKKANDFFEKCWEETLLPVPLDVLEELVDRWIKSRQAG
jgi:hypothetical protein